MRVADRRRRDAVAVIGRATRSSQKRDRCCTKHKTKNDSLAMAFDRSLLARATEGTDAPTPGYLYLDLAKAASANPSAAAEMASYLTKRLSSKANPNIKAKCCKVIAKLCEQVNHFRRCLTQDPSSVAAIKEAMAFRGALDPVQGDAKNEKVRQAAKEALDAVYSESAPSTISSSYAPSPHMSSPGFGSASAAGPRRMEGIGNPRYQDPRMEGPPSASGNKVADAVQEAGSVILGMIKDPLARNVDVGPPRQGHSGNLPGYGSHQATVCTSSIRGMVHDGYIYSPIPVTVWTTSSWSDRVVPTDRWTVDDGKQPWAWSHSEQ